MSATIDQRGWVVGSIPGPNRRYTVEKRVILRTSPNDPFLKLTLIPANLVLHTTEGDSVNGAISTLDAKHSPSQWIVGEHRIVQTRPIWAQGAAVDTENARAMQIEMVAHSQLARWLPPPATLEPAVALVAWLKEAKRISSIERRAELAGLPVVLDRMPAATDAYYRRHLGVWPASGVYGHVDLPNDEHWDPGSFDYPKFLAMVKKIGDDGMGLLDDLNDMLVRRLNKDGPPAADASSSRKQAFEFVDKLVDAVEAGSGGGNVLPDHGHDSSVGKVKP